LWRAFDITSSIFGGSLAAARSPPLAARIATEAKVKSATQEEKGVRQKVGLLLLFFVEGWRAPSQSLSTSSIAPTEILAESASSTSSSSF